MFLSCISLGGEKGRKEISRGSHQDRDGRGEGNRERRGGGDRRVNDLRSVAVRTNKQRGKLGDCILLYQFCLLWKVLYRYMLSLFCLAFNVQGKFP